MAPSFKDAIDSGKFIITGEIGPPKGTNIEEMLHHIDVLKDKVDGLNVTDNQSSVMRLSSLSVCHLIKERGGEPILQMTCRDRNRMALQSDLLSANILGIHNLLCLTGDYITVGDHIEAKPVFDLDSVQLLQTVKMLQEGKDLGGNKLSGPAQFCVGAIVTPEANPLEPQLLKFEKKVKVGVKREEEMLFKCDLGQIKLENLYIDEKNKKEADKKGVPLGKVVREVLKKYASENKNLI